MEILDLLGDEPANADHLPMLEEQFGTRAGIVPFVGAGLSAPFGFPAWGAFLTELAAEGGTVEKTKARLDAAQYEEAASDLMEALGHRRFQDLLAARFGDRRLEGLRIEGAVSALPDLPSGPIITTNFDRLIETAFAQRGRPITPYWHSYASKGSEALQQDRPFLLKLHGDWDHPTTRILTLDEYTRAYGDISSDDVSFSLPLPTLLFKLLASRCCLFLGCSLRQDRTIQLLRAIARGIPDLVHYAIVEKPAGVDEFRQRAAELSAQSIRPVWYPHGAHDTIQPLLAHLATKAAQGLQRLAASLRAPVAPAAHVPNNIPDLGNVTIGRDSEIGQIADMLRVARLVSVTGVGGCGKSRVAVEVSRATEERYHGGVWFIPLADLAKKADRERVLPSRVGKILNVPEQPGRSPYEGLAEHLATGRVLLVLDNCEHLIKSCRDLANYLLQKCPDLTILATSRRPLKLAQERLYPLAPLRTPEPGLADVSALAENESVQLFVDRARQRSPEWQLQAEHAVAVADLCRALAGIPLAIEVAAARLSVRSVEEMSARSQDLIAALGNSRSGDLRSWTLSAALRWSYGLLRPHEQLFMRSMTVFDGGWSEESAEAVFLDPRGEPGSVLDYLQVLVDNSLLVTSDVQGKKRFRYLEPVRQVVGRELAEDERRECERRHAEFFLQLTERAAPELLKADQATWLDRLQVEVDNLRGAIRWCVDTGDCERGLRLMAGLWRFAEIRGYFKEGLERAQQVLDIPGAGKFPALRSKVLSGAGMLAYRQADFDTAQTMFQKSLDIEVQADNQAGIANAKNDLGIVATMKGDFARAHTLYSESLAIERRNDNKRAIAVAQYNLGMAALAIGDHAQADDLLSESLNGFRAGGNDRESAFPLNGLGQLYTVTGKIALAEEHAQESLALRQRVKDAKGIADSLRTLGWAALEGGKFVSARERLVESLNLARGVGDRRGMSETLELIGILAAREGRARRSVELLAAAEQIRSGFNYALPPMRARMRETTLGEAKQTLGPDNFASAWRRGASWALPDAIESVTRESTVGT
jgi:predicted ATPase/Tfp pilus assembly protein PilF